MLCLKVGGEISSIWQKNYFGGAHKAGIEILSDFSVFIGDVFRKGSESVRYLIITKQYIDVVRTLCHI